MGTRIIPKTHHQRSGRSPLILRSTWVALAAIVLALNAAGLPASYAKYKSVCTSAACTHSEEIARLTPEGVRALRDLGLSPEFYGAYVGVVLPEVVALTFATVAGFTTSATLSIAKRSFPGSLDTLNFARTRQVPLHPFCSARLGAVTILPLSDASPEVMSSSCSQSSPTKRLRRTYASCLLPAHEPRPHLPIHLSKRTFREPLVVFPIPLSARRSNSCQLGARRVSLGR